MAFFSKQSLEALPHKKNELEKNIGFFSEREVK
jgi:hypothetical protein